MDAVGGIRTLQVYGWCHLRLLGHGSGRKAGFHKLGGRIGATGALTRGPTVSLRAESIGVHFGGLHGGSFLTGGHGGETGGHVFDRQFRAVASLWVEYAEVGDRICRAATTAAIQTARLGSARLGRRHVGPQEMPHC